jgi:hypothetical protein
MGILTGMLRHAMYYPGSARAGPVRRAQLGEEGQIVRAAKRLGRALVLDEPPPGGRNTARRC